ncbi:protein of unknown function [Pararobbsia alpina]
MAVKHDLRSSLRSKPLAPGIPSLIGKFRRFKSSFGLHSVVICELARNELSYRKTR